jgi:hypothetical protein
MEKDELTKEEIAEFKFSFDLSKANYQLDSLQNELLQFYIRADKRFRRAFSMNYTNQFLQYIRDKTRLNEPLTLSVIGGTRQGKSYSSITIAQYHQLQYGKLFTSEYICGNVFEYLEKLQTFPTNKLFNRVFICDENKQSVYNIGSLARKSKVEDVANITAINNISTIMLTPYQWSNKNANYGIRAFGRCFDTKTVRLMLYNLTESGKGGTLPLGNIYLPIFTAFYPKRFGDIMEKEYLAKKHGWVDLEREGNADVLSMVRKKIAIQFSKDPKYNELKKKKLKIAYILLKVGSEYTTKEVESIEEITQLIKDGYVDADDM